MAGPCCSCVFYLFSFEAKPNTCCVPEKISALKKHSDEVGIRESCELQYFFKHDLYACRSQITTENDASFCEKAFGTVEELLEKASVPIRTARDCERHGLRRLRILRVLNPIRKILVAAGRQAKHLPRRGVLLMDSYM